MKLYMIQFDAQPHYVEAESLTEAIRLWSVWLTTEDPGLLDEPEFLDEPESVTLVHGEPVIRRAEGNTPLSRPPE